jgi:hypothetical protein
LAGLTAATFFSTYFAYAVLASHRTRARANYRRHNLPCLPSGGTKGTSP